jgi:hypothetical protein
MVLSVAMAISGEWNIASAQTKSRCRASQTFWTADRPLDGGGFATWFSPEKQPNHDNAIRTFANKRRKSYVYPSRDRREGFKPEGGMAKARRWENQIAPTCGRESIRQQRFSKTRKRLGKSRLVLKRVAGATW